MRSPAIGHRGPLQGSIQKRRADTAARPGRGAASARARALPRHRPSSGPSSDPAPQRVPRFHIDSVGDFRQSFWDCWVREPYRVLGSDELIVDAGANIGCFSIYAVSKSRRGHVFALEPSSRNFQRLVDNIRLNRLDRRITALPVGVAGQSGTQELDVSHASPYHSVYTEVGPDRETIRVLSLSALLGEIGGPDQVDLLKMDCEGGEMECLLESSSEDLARIRRIAVEYHEWAGFSFPSLVERLRTSGFTMRSHVRNEKDRTGVVEFVGR